MSVSPVEVQKHLKGVSYPADRDELVECARDESAPDDVMDALEGLTEDQFDGPDDVMEALGSGSALGNGDSDSQGAENGSTDEEEEDVGQ